MLAGAVRERAVIPGAAGSVSPCRSDAMLDQPLVIFSKSAVTFSLLFKKKTFLGLNMGCIQSNSSAPSMLFSFFMGRKIISESLFSQSAQYLKRFM